MATLSEVLQPLPDPLWETVMREIDRLQGDGYRMVSRSPAYRRNVPDGEAVLCIYRVHPVRDTVMQHVFHIEAYHVHKHGQKTIEVRVDGPFEDSRDQYWRDIARHDSERGNALVTEDYVHYTVRPDSRQPGQGDGFGGREFRFLVDSAVAERLRKRNLKVDYDLDSYPVLTTRNLWEQGTIPEKHRHLFPPNCKIL